MLTQTFATIITLFLLCSVTFADHPQSTQGPVKVSFVFPDGALREITLTYKDCADIFKQRPLPKHIPVEYYKIDWWIYAALQSLDIDFEIQSKNKRTSIIRIDKYENDTNGKWVYFVNGTRSRYHINTQLDEDVKIIKFVFEKK